MYVAFSEVLSIMIRSKLRFIIKVKFFCLLLSFTFLAL